MKVGIKRSIITKPGTTPEQTAEVMKLFETKFIGLEQAMKGKIKRITADQFLLLFPLETRQSIEEQVDRLHGLKDPVRFRTETLLMFAEVLLMGLVVAKDEELLGVFEKWFEDMEIAVSKKK